MPSKVWSICSGKGGVGKTFCSVSFAITASKLQQRVLIIDLDQSGANVHTTLGTKHTHSRWPDYLKGNIELCDTILDSEIPKLWWIPGDLHSSIEDLWTTERVEKFFKDLHSLNYDLILLDLGAGTSKINLEIFKRSDEKILIVNPDPSSIEKSYRFLETFWAHRLAEYATPEAAQKLIKALNEFKQIPQKNLFSLREYVRKNDSFSVNYFDLISEGPIKLVVNGCRSIQERDLGHCMKSICNKYYDLKVDYLGSIDHDNAVWHSLKSHEPFLIHKPLTALSGQFLSMARSLIGPRNSDSHSVKAVI